MEVDYMLACGIVWQRTADPVAGMELIEGLESKDPCIQEIAKTILVECGEPSMKLLESAVTAGIVSPDSAGPCMAEILGSHHEQDFVLCGQFVN
jgi:hypothetical protein